VNRPIALAFLAAMAWAADLPRPAGLVNDFAEKLQPSERESLESKLRDYEQATSNEVAIAIVQSLDGQSVEEYANRLFKAWGIGKKERNNGVLLLWAPAERKVRIEVGLGLESAIPNEAAADILRSVTAAFRQEDYAGGLNAGVDGIIARLNGYGAGPEPEEPRPRSSLLLIPAFAIAGLIASVIILWRNGRRRQLSASLPRDLDRAVAAMGEIETIRKNAVAALEDLRREAPEAVWEEFQSVIANAPAELPALHAELATIRAMPQGQFDELNRAHRALKRWNNGFSKLWERLSAVGPRLDSFRYCREHSQLMLTELGASLDRRATDPGWGRRRDLVQAASDTYTRAMAAAAASQVNWLLVYDLLIDTQDCLQCADDPGQFRRGSRVRNWYASENDSPAFVMLDTASQSSWSAGSSSIDSGSSSASDSGSSFGGGDSGGGGASSSY
jgi:uncharacterized protein